jgi:4-amino-4-deoxy-L-arabinose transferase-like glycosyltransferase
MGGTDGRASHTNEMMLGYWTTVPARRSRGRWLDLTIVLAAMLLMGSIAGWRMTHNAMWGDEVRTWRDSVGKSYREIFTWTHNKDHAPLGHLLTKVSSDAFNTQEPWALRLPAYIFGLAIVPLGYLLGRLASGRLAAILIVVMICVDITITTQTHWARMYTQFVVWTMAALCCAAALLRDPRRAVLKTLSLGLFLGLSI